MTQTPETLPNGTAHDQIQANIYEYVSENLYGEKMDEIRDEKQQKGVKDESN